MRIAIMVPSLNLSGGIRRVVGLSNELMRRGHVVEIYHSDGGPCKWLRLEATVKPLAKLPGQEFDVFMWHESTADAKEMESQVSARCKVFYILGFEPIEFNNPTSIRSTVFGRLVHREDILVLGCSSWMKSWFAENAPEVRIETLLKGVDWDLFHPEKRPDMIVPTILRSGDTRKRKNHVQVLEALKIVRQKYPDAAFPSYYRLGHPQSQMARVYSSAHVFVDAQMGYGFANAPFEAMACGTALVCTDCFGVEDFAFDRKTALLVPVGNPGAMAAAIIELYEDQHLASRLARRGYNHLVQNFDWLETGEKFIDLVKERIGILDPRDKAAAKAFTIPGKTREIELKTLYDVAKSAPPGIIVDLGTYQGRSAAAMAMTGRAVVTIDNFTEGPSAKHPGGTHPTPMRVQFNLSHFGLDKSVTIIQGDTGIVPDQVKEKSIGMVFIDGAHVEAQLVRDMAAWEPLLPIGGFLAFHDFGNPSWPDVERVVTRDLNLNKWKFDRQTKWTRVFRRVS